MAFNGSGTFNRLYTWVIDAANGIKIRADRMDAEMDGFATGLTDCVTRDGQSPWLANLPAGGFRLTGMGDGVAADDSATLRQVQGGKNAFAIGAGTANAITAAFVPTFVTLTDGVQLNVRALLTNTSPIVTFAPDAITAHPITRFGGTQLSVGDIAGPLHELQLRYNLANTRWELLNPAPVAIIPQGRLTLTSLTPILTTDVLAATSIYYTPYQGNQAFIYDGNGLLPIAFSELTLALDSNSGHTGYHQSGKLFDLFLINDAGTLRLATGPAWSSSTARGTGAGTTELEMVNGLWVNKNALANARFGSASGNVVAVAARYATYLGTVYCTANGQTAMQINPTPAIGGNNSFMALFNAYNRVQQFCRSQDSTATWNYTSTTWRQMDGSANNKVNVVQGLIGEEMTAYIENLCDNANTSTPAFYVSVSFDGSTTTPDTRASWMTGNPPGAALAMPVPYTCRVDNSAIGLVTVTPLERGNGAGTLRWGGTGSFPGIGSIQVGAKV